MAAGHGGESRHGTRSAHAGLRAAEGRVMPGAPATKAGACACRWPLGRPSTGPAGRRRPGVAICCSTMARRPISSPAACASMPPAMAAGSLGWASEAGSRRSMTPAARATRAAGRRLHRRPAPAQRAADRAEPGHRSRHGAGLVRTRARLGLARPRSWPGCAAGFGRYRDKRARLRSAHELLALGRQLMAAPPRPTTAPPLPCASAPGSTATG